MDVLYERGDDGEYDRLLVRGEEIVLTMLPMTRKGTLAEDPVPLAMRVIDESRTRVYQIDSICVYADFKLIQRLLSMDALERADRTKTPPRTTQLLVQLHPEANPRDAQQRIQQAWDEFCMQRFYGLSPERYRGLTGEEQMRLWREVREGWIEGVDVEDALMMSQVAVQTWEDRQQGFISAVEKEKVLVTILFLIISLVAIVLIGVIFHMIVMQKTRDIGIIKSLGATCWGWLRSSFPTARPSA
jgi:lipoprotein-releasing system permease protein